MIGLTDDHDNGLRVRGSLSIVLHSMITNQRPHLSVPQASPHPPPSECEARLSLAGGREVGLTG